MIDFIDLPDTYYGESPSFAERPTTPHLITWGAGRKPSLSLCGRKVLHTGEPFDRDDYAALCRTCVKVYDRLHPTSEEN